MVLRGPGLSDVCAMKFGASHGDSAVIEALGSPIPASWPRITSVVLDRPTAMCAGHSTASSATAVIHFSAVPSSSLRPPHSSPRSMVLRGPDSRAPWTTALNGPDPRHVCAADLTADSAAQADLVVRRSYLAWRTCRPGVLRRQTLLIDHAPAISLDLGRPSS